jgi:hypothetical protein
LGGRLSQEDHEFEDSLGYTVRSCLKNKQKNKGGKEGRIEGRKEVGKMSSNSTD